MDNALIISPTGCSMFFDDAYDKNHHWRSTNALRTYETVIIGFKEDYEPESNSYDHFFHYPIRYKWKQLPELLNFLKTKNIHWENYDYIGYWDDDYCKIGRAHV